MSFTFGNSGAGGNSQSPFGTNTSQNSGTPGLFGGAKPPATSAFGQSTTPTTTAPPSTGLFGGGATSGSTLFGKPATTGSAPTPSIFGATPASNSASGTSTPLFGGAATSTAPQAGSIFGKPTPNSSTPASGTSTPFGAKPSTSGFNFGPAVTSASSIIPTTTTTTSTAATTTAPTMNTAPTPAVTGGLFPAMNSASASPFGGMNSSGGLGQAKIETTAPTTVATAPAVSGGLFVNVNKPAGSTGLFGNLSGGMSSSSTPQGLSTPAPSKGLFKLNSTTPAGPPPSDTTQTTKAPTSSLFGSVGQQPAGGLFGGSKAPEFSQAPATSANTANAPAPLFGAKPTPTSNLFPSLGASTSAGSAAISTTAAAEAPKPALGFSSLPSAAGQQPPSASSAPPSSSLFGLLNKPANSASSAPAPSLFGAKSTVSTTAATTATSAPAPSLFGATGPASAAPAPASTGPAAASTIFGKPVTATSATPSASTPAASGAALAGGAVAADTTKGATVGLGASSAGPPPQQSRLKNKTVDEIITRWASDLSKYQKEFQDQAAKVASWDRLLVENGDKIQSLFASTHEAKRSGVEVERQLAAVESQQEEISTWLDHYEANIEEMFSRQWGQGDTLQGPDQERERTYQLAERLNNRLDEMGRDLASMIEAINEASSNLSKDNKADDPLSHIVRVLNSHLSQLQWIDQNAEILKKKVEAAQNLGQNMSTNGYGAQENDTVESFYRSYMGRR